MVAVLRFHLATSGHGGWWCNEKNYHLTVVMLSCNRLASRVYSHLTDSVPDQDFGSTLTLTKVLTEQECLLMVAAKGPLSRGQFWLFILSFLLTALIWLHAAVFPVFRHLGSRELFLNSF